ncbi:MAG: decarboxylase [Myxococcales bacterium]|nr:decarboxylase [Myxococcales bacterium]
MTKSSSSSSSQELTAHAEIPRGDLPFELSAEQMRSMADTLAARVIAHVDSLEGQPARAPLADAVERSRALRDAEPAAPEHGRSLEAAVAPLFEDWVHQSFNTAGPGYMAYMPAGGLFVSALADFVAAALNRYTGVWNASPLLVQLEANVLQWLRQWMGFPPSARGLLVSGGSMAMLGAVVTAREHALGERLRDGVLYTSRAAHACVGKAARTAGVLPDRVRLVDVDDRSRLRVDSLARAIDADGARGLVPFMVVSTAGTVGCGAVDPLDEIATLCAERCLWHHVDAAYGGFFMLLPELRETLAGLERADSLTLDPHKGLFLPYGSGALLVRDGELLRAAHDWHGEYLPELPPADMYNPCQYGPELSRPFRGLRLWLALQVHGAARFREALAHKRELALWAADALRASGRFDLLAPPALSLFAYRLRSPAGDEHAIDGATRALIERVNRRGRALLSGDVLGGRYYGRLNVLSFRTQRRHVERCVEDLIEEAGAA